MRLTRRTLLCVPAALALPALGAETAAPDWVEAMRWVHARFTGKKGTFAQFGDSITVTRAFWSPLRYTRRNLDPGAAKAFEQVNAYQQPQCWEEWKGPEFGSQGGMTIRWARENVHAWLKRLNPETALIMFGSNDLGQVELPEYEAKTREVVQRCLDNGSVVILSTIPPRSGRLDKSRQFAEAVRRVGRELKVPVVDYFDAILKRRPDDWEGSLEKFRDGGNDPYDVPTLIARDGVHPSNPKKWQGDYSEEGLRSSGYVLRNYVTLLAYADVLGRVLRPEGT